MATQRYRVAQWATGSAGMPCLRAVIEHPLFDLVAVRVYSDSKAGRDAGELCGLPPTGVIATKDSAAVLAAKPDCVLYVPDRLDVEELAEILESGSNVVTARVEFTHRASVEPEVRSRLEAACERGRSTLYSTGSVPGFFTEHLPFALSMLESRLDCITVSDTSDMSSDASESMLFDILPFGMDPAAIDPADPAKQFNINSASLTMTAKALGLGADEFRSEREFAVARNPVQVMGRTVERGRVGALRRINTGLRGGKPVIRRISTLYVTKDIDPDWELHDGFHYRVEGDVPFEVSITKPRGPDGQKLSGGMTSNPVVNAVPFICAAKPGIVQTDELPSMRGNFGR